MSLDDEIVKLQRAGADAARARIADGRTYNTYNHRGFGPLYVLLACFVGVVATVVAAWAFNYSPDTPEDRKTLAVVHATGVGPQMAAMGADELRARMAYDPSIVTALSGALRDGIAEFVYRGGQYLAQFQSENDRAWATERFLRLLELGAENAKRVDQALALAQSIDPEAASTCAFLATSDLAAIKTLSSMDSGSRRACLSIASLIARNPTRLEPTVKWLGDGKPLPQCDAVAPACSIEGSLYGVTCAPGNYVSIAPFCTTCPGGWAPQRKANGVIQCIYKR